MILAALLPDDKEEDLIKGLRFKRLFDMYIRIFGAARPVL